MIDGWSLVNSGTCTIQHEPTNSIRCETILSTLLNSIPKGSAENRPKIFQGSSASYNQSVAKFIMGEFFSLGLFTVCMVYSKCH